ncbi:MAG: CoA pyrophosphatase [Halioglobus sp.]|nr:CoA pyrophosphatase [Halioglobus sp.]
MNDRNNSVFARLRSALDLPRQPWRDAFGSTEYPQAAVLVALTDEPAPRVLLGRRAQHLPMHPGEVAFPGGKRDAADASPWATAEREAFEEVALDPAQVSQVAELEPLITRTGFEVFPCIARVPDRLDLVVDAAEFDSVFTLPLQTFADSTIYRVEAMSDGRNRRMVPHYQVGDDNVWGVTAAILALLANVAYDAGLDLQRNWKVKP